MFKHLKYIDGTSDKFWEIQTAGSTHTVTYGRNGTAGQSKSKTFDSEEACLKDAEKLIAEKTKKGYSEDGTVGADSKEKSSAVRQPTAASQRKEEAVAALKLLIKEARTEDIIPFLEEYSSGNLEILKKEIRAAKRYWVDYSDLSKDPEFKSKAQYNWGTRGTKEQQRTVKLLALATFSGSDAGSWDIFYELLNQARSKDVIQILAYAKPNWLGGYLLQLVRKNEWQQINYDNLRFLEQMGHVDFEPELYASSISGFNNYESKRFFDLLTTDELTVQRDIPLVFEYETGIHSRYWDYNYQNAVNELLWDKVFDTLLENGKIDRELIITGALEAQTKNWNNNLKSYFRKLIERMKLSENTVIEHQQRFFSLLHAEHSAVINFVVEYLKPFLSNRDFQLQEFLDWAEPIFMRSDVKASLKALLIQFDKLLKQKSELQERFVSLAADIFMIPDLQLQERAAKFILKYQKEPFEELTAKLQLYKPQMMGAIGTDLKHLLLEEGYSEEEILAELQGETIEQYRYQPVDVRRLNEPYEYPQTWNELFFKVGEVIGGSDPIQVEILMNAWVQQTAIFPSDYQIQLEPYIKQLTGAYRESSWYNYFSGTFINMYYKPTVVYKDKDRYHNYSKWVSLMGSQLELLQRYRIDGVRLPLLSLPTHRPFWIAPTILVERILAYQEAGVKINLLDLSIALSRTVREDLEGIEALMKQIKEQQVKDVISYALGLDPIKVQQQSWLKNLLSSKDSDQVNWIGVWATVARTHHRDTHFEEFAKEPLADIPFAAQPFRPALKIEPTYYNGYNYTTRKSEQVYNGDKLTYHFPSYKQGAETFLHHKDIFNRGNNTLLSYYLYRADVPYMHSLMPQNTESLSMFLTMGLNSKSDIGGKSSAAYLQEMLYDFFRFDQQSSLYLATSLFNKEKEVRAMAVEVILAAVNENRLDTTVIGEQLGMLLSNGYGPIGRCVEVLEQCRDISSKHNNALLQLLDAAFVHYIIAEKMPTNFKKIVEYYYDLMNKEQYHFTDDLQQVFEKLEIYKSLQPILKKIRK
ncbi:WGR domain protein [compost metagenome]